jgi:hypothetical protein
MSGAYSIDNRHFNRASRVARRSCIEQASVFGASLYGEDGQAKTDITNVHWLNGVVEAIEITETHRVHEHAGSAIIRARKPAA